MKFNNPYIFMVKSCWRYGDGARFRFVLNYIFSTLGHSVRLLQPFIIGTAINSIQLNEPNLLNKLFWLFLFYFLSEVVFRIFHGTSDYLRTWLGFVISKNFKNQIYSKLTKLPLIWHSENHSGKTIKQIETVSNKLYKFNQEQYLYVHTFVNLFVPLSALFFISHKVGILTLIGSVIIITNTIFFDKHIRKYYEIIVKKEYRVSSVIFDYLSNITTIIILKVEKLTRKELDKRMSDVYPETMKWNVLSLGKWSLYDLIMGFMTASLLFLFCYDSYVNTGIIVVGSLTMIYSYLEKMKSTFFNVNFLYSQLIINQTEIEMAEEIFAQKETHPLNSNKKVNWNKIDIKIPNFKYEKDKKIINLKNINIEIPKKSRIAFIGRSGSGKSTLLKILRGLYDCDNSVLLINGKESKFSAIKNITTLIPQEPEIFESTIENNITFGVRTIKKKVIKAIKLSKFDSVLKKLPNGLDTYIDEKGVNLSGGEKQRLALARGLFAVDGTDIILLDEPTSSVDPENERRIYNGIFKEFSDKTIVSALHRLHLLKKFDYIYFFDKGKLIGEGNFKELLKNKKFKKMWEKYNM